MKRKILLILIIIIFLLLICLGLVIKKDKESVDDMQYQRMMHYEMMKNAIQEDYKNN